MVQQRLFNSEDAETVDLLGVSIYELLGRLTKKVNDDIVPKEYPPDLRTLLFPGAYEYVHEKFRNCLPHSKTISSWYKSINGEPGILGEAIDAIKERVKLASPTKLMLAVIFDEIAIREQVELVGNSFFGYVNLGPNFPTEQVPAKEALVFVVVCINDGWKIPVAYFLVKSTTAECKKK